jgi:phasin
MSNTESEKESTTEAMGAGAGESSGSAADMMNSAEKSAQDMMNQAQSMMGMDPAKLTETFRTMTQKSVEQSKEAYARMKSAADDATKTMESTMENVHQSSLSLSKKAIEAMRSNAELSFAHIEKMMSAKSFSEVIEMQTSYVRKQIELATDQSKDMQALAQSVAQELTKPARDAFQKAAGAARTF